MAKNKKNTYKVPNFLEIYQSQRVQVVTPKGGAHGIGKEYNRKQKHKREWAED